MTAAVSCPCTKAAASTRQDMARHLVEGHLIGAARAIVMAELLVTGRPLLPHDLALLAPSLTREPTSVRAEQADARLMETAAL